MRNLFRGCGPGALAALLLGAVGWGQVAEAKDWRSVVNVQPHPSYDYAWAFTECSVDKFGNIFILTCDEVHSDPILEDLPGPHREVHTLDIGIAPISEHLRYIGECKENGDDGVTMAFKCDDTIFKNGFGKKRHSS